jgi:hypothetical protein
MIKISRSSLNHLNESFLKEQEQRLIAQLRKSYPLLIQEMGERRFLDYVHDDLEDARALEIESDDSSYLYLALRFELTEKQRETRLVQEVLLRTLNRLEWPEEKRLGFIYENLSTLKMHRS